MKVPFFWVNDPIGPINLKVDEKAFYSTDGFWGSVHPFYWSINGHKSIKGSRTFSHNFDAPGIYKLRVREGCPFFGESAVSNWSKELKIEVVK